MASVDVEDVIEAIRKDWRRWRWPVYLLVFIAQAATSWIPVAPAILMFVSLIAVELLMIRRPLRWLSVRRRIVSRASLRLSAAVITIIDLLLNLVLLPLIGVNVLTIGVVGTLLVVGYVEVSLAVVGAVVHLGLRRVDRGAVGVFRVHLERMVAVTHRLAVAERVGEAVAMPTHVLQVAILFLCKGRALAGTDRASHSEPRGRPRKVDVAARPAANRGARTGERHEAGQTS